MTGNTVAIVGGYVVPVTAEPIDGATILIEDGTITAIGTGLNIPADATVIDAHDTGGPAHVYRLVVKEKK